MMRNRILSTVLLMSFCSVSAAGAAESVTPSQMVEILRNSHVLKPAVQLRATYDDHTKRVTILTDRYPKESDNDCKIDAVLVAKKLVDSFPDEVSVVRLIFNTTGKTPQQIDVTKVHVKAYGSGAVKADELLSSLNLVDSEIATTQFGAGNGLSVVPGPLADQRLIILGRIDALKKGGTGVGAFMTLFKSIEAEAANGDETKATKDIEFLSEKLTTQEDLVKQAKVVRSPSGNKGSSGSVQTAQTNAHSNVNTQDISRRCDDWERKFALWKKEHRDVTQLEYSLVIVRGFIVNGQADMAKNYLDALDHTLAAPPPIQQ